MAGALQRFGVAPLAEVAITAFALGVAFAASAGLILWGLLGAEPAPWAVPVGCYLFCTVPMFHLSEFLIAAQYRPHDATPRSFMIFHSMPFVIAVGVAWVETLLGGVLGLLPWHPGFHPIAVAVGTLASLVCYGIRAVSMIQCGRNFSLLVEYRKRAEHQLVTSGLYGLFRHPSYFGWFWHIVATQLIVCNPVCLVGFAAVTWKFFQVRIREEEALLRSPEFFGTQYDAYCDRVPTRIPLL